MYRSLFGLLTVSILITGSFVSAQDTTGVVKQESVVKDTTPAVTTTQIASPAVVNSPDSTSSVNNVQQSLPAPAQVASPTVELTKDSTKVEASTVELASNEKGNDTKSQKRSGIGLNFGVRLFYPSEVNKLLSDIWDEMKTGYQVSDYGVSTDIIAAYSFKFKGIIYPVPFFCIEPYAQVLYGPKYLALTGDAHLYEMLNLLDFSGGLDLWFKVSPQKRFSFKMGVGGFGCYDYININGDIGKVTFSGSGVGFNGLAGLDISFSKVTINIDFIVPVGWVKLKRDGALDWESWSNDNTRYPYRYPKKLNLTGFEFKPGVTFQF